MALAAMGGGVGPFNREPITLRRLVDEVVLLLESGGPHPAGMRDLTLVIASIEATVERLVDRSLLAPGSVVSDDGGLVLPGTED